MVRRQWGPPSFEKDERGAFLVFEAVLVAIFIFTSVLFITSIQHPTQDLERGDVNLGLIAADTLEVLQNREPLDNDTYDNRLEEIVALAMSGNSTDGHALIQEVIPQQSRYVLRLNNGVEELHLMPEGSGLQVEPRGAQGAESFIMPNWTSFEEEPVDAVVYPGQRVTSGAAYEMTTGDGNPKCIFSPLDDEYTPGPQDNSSGTSWFTHWGQNPGEVPLDIPYGVWRGINGQFCASDRSYVRVLMPPGDLDTTRPVYGVQLVIWRGA